VASETWAQVCRDLPKFRGDGDGFRGWVTTIGRHRALDHLRQVRRRPVCDEPIDGFVHVPDATDVEGDTLGRVQSEAALALIASLPRDQAGRSCCAPCSASTPPLPRASSASGRALSEPPRTAA
jgi:RNA polymerase sigma-70 factor (ECF subfamily)